MVPRIVRLTPVLLTVLLALASAADAHALDDLIQCVWEGPNGNCN